MDLDEATKLGHSLRKPLEQYSLFVEKSCPLRCRSAFAVRRKMIGYHLAGVQPSISQGINKATCNSHFMNREDLTDKWFKDNNNPPESIEQSNVERKLIILVFFSCAHFFDLFIVF